MKQYCIIGINKESNKKVILGCQYQSDFVKYIESTEYSRLSSMADLLNEIAPSVQWNVKNKDDLDGYPYPALFLGLDKSD